MSDKMLFVYVVHQQGETNDVRTAICGIFATYQEIEDYFENRKDLRVIISIQASDYEHVFYTEKRDAQGWVANQNNYPDLLFFRTFRRAIRYQELD